MIDPTQSNRILEAAARMQAALDSGQKIDGSGPITADLDELERSLALTPMEVFAYQNAQARAHATGKLTTGEAQTVYAAIGEGGDWAKDTSLALKLTIQTLMGQLIGGRR